MANEICHPDLVKNIQQTEYDVSTLLNMASLFKAMGDPTRLRILRALSQHPICVCDLATALKMTKSAISHQLRYLRNLNLVQGEKKGKMVYYELTDEHVRVLLEKTFLHVQEVEDEKGI